MMDDDFRSGNRNNVENKTDQCHVTGMRSGHLRERDATYPAERKRQPAIKWRMRRGLVGGHAHPSVCDVTDDQSDT